MHLRVKATKDKTLCKNGANRKKHSYAKTIPTSSVHKTQSHDIPPAKRMKNALITEFEKTFNFSESNILPTSENGRYSTRKRVRVEPLLKPQKLLKKAPAPKTENIVEKLVVAEKESFEIIHDEESVSSHDTEKEGKGGEWSKRERKVRLIAENLITNLRQIPLLNELDAAYLDVTDDLLGEGQYGTVRLGTYHGIPAACKSRRTFAIREKYVLQTYRELEFAAKLSLCRYINRYIGWVYCNKRLVETKARAYMNPSNEFFIVQPYVEYADARRYLSRRDKKFQHNEVLQASICLFSALTDAHSLNIGIVDLKLENFLIDPSGSGWLTDFGSCIDIKGESSDLDDEGVHWTRSVAAPEMLTKRTFFKASDVFMGTLIIAELMTAELSDEEFSRDVIQRQPTGEVSFSSRLIGESFEEFFNLLSRGLSNEPEQRPDAKTMLDLLLKMK